MSQDKLVTVNQRLEKLLCQNGIGFLELDLTGKVYDTNIAYCKLLSAKSTEDIIGKNVSEWTSKLTREKNSEAFAQIVKTGEIRNLVCHYQTFSNQNITVSINAYSEQLSNGVHIYALCQDITQQNKERSHSQNQYELLRSIIDSTPDLIFGKDLDGKFVICNKAVENLLQKTEAELLGKTDLDLFSPEIASFFKIKDQQVITQNKTCINEEWIAHPSNDLFLVETLKTPYYDSDLNIKGIFGISRDITERKKTETNFHVLNNENKIIFDNIPVGIGYLKDRHFYRVNQHWSNMFGWEEHEIVNQSTETFYFHKHDFISLGEEAYPLMQQGQIYRSERLMKRKDGTSIWCQLIGHSISHNAPEKGSIWIITDISKEKHHRNLLQLEKQKSDYLKELAEKANQAKSEFLANISHELRTPLHAILSFSNFGIKKLQDKEYDKITRYLENIDISGQRLLNLLNDLLDISKLEAGKMDFNFQAVNIKTIIYNCLIEQQTRLEEKQISVVKNNFDCDIPIPMDSVKISQVVSNLLSNAIKFSAEGTCITISISIENQYIGKYEKTESILKVTISDEGLGIPKNELMLIFDKFTQSSKTDNKAGGTGLGLSICEEIIKGHQGAIWAEHNPAGGAIFNFTIPLNRQKSKLIPCTEY